MRSVRTVRFASLVLLGSALCVHGLSLRQQPAPAPAKAGAQRPEEAKPAAPAVSPEAARQAQQLFEAGRAAERDAQWHLAFANYAEAARLHPEKSEYALARELAKFRIAQEHVERAEAAAASGQLDLAILELRASLALDPSYQIARDRLRQLRSIASREVRIREEPNDGQPQLRLTRQTQDINFRGNTRSAYEEVARLFNLTATFDDGIRSRSLQIRLPGVDALTALNVLAKQTDTYWLPISDRSFFVTDDTEQRRREYEPSVVRTLTLPASATNERMTELIRVLRDILDIRRVQLDTRSRTLTIRDSPDTVALATALVQEFEQGRGEVMLEMTFAEVDRRNALRLGLLPPSQAQLFSISPDDLRRLQNPQQSFGDLAALLQRIFGTGAASSLGGLVPPLIAFGGGRTVGLATLPGASAEFSQAMSVFRTARRVLLRSEDGQPASFFIGERYPINYSVLSSNISTPIPGVPGGGVVPRQDFAAGDGPSAIAAFDVNGDNALDLIVANQVSNTVSVLLGNVDGTFGAPANFAVGLSPASVALGDFNSDGDLDIVTANEGDDTISVLLGDGTGGFGAATAFPVGSRPRAVAAGNLNNDGSIDLVVANFGSNTISVMLGNSTGAFNTRADFTVGAGPIGLALFDFDRDSFLDVAVSNQTSNEVTVLLGAGNGVFSSAQTFPVGTAPRGMVAVNINADSHQDLVVANEGGDSVSILLGNGDGTFTSTEFGTGPRPRDVFAADFDGSGTIDVITANNSNDSISLLLGNGDGTLGLRADLGSGNGPTALAAGNFNADGRIDLAIANELSDNVTVILNTSTFSPPGGFQGAQQPYPAFQFEELGLKIRATPHMHPANEVTLDLSVEIRSRSGESFNGLPVISNRTLEETVRLKEGETTVVAGIVQRDETLSLRGTPGLSQYLLPGPATRKRDKEARETELLIFITPRRLRLTPRADRTLVAAPGGSTARRPSVNP